VQLVATLNTVKNYGYITVEYRWNMMAHDAWEVEWRGKWRMECVCSTLHTTSEHGVSSITTADAHISAASSRLNWRPRRLKWTRPFHRKTKSGFCACTITFQTQSTSVSTLLIDMPDHQFIMIVVTAGYTSSMLVGWRTALSGPFTMVSLEFIIASILPAAL